MEKFCKNKEHKTCCKEWGIVCFVASIFYALLLFFPSVAFALLDAMTSTIGMGILSIFVFGAAARKMQVHRWENDRPFNDGDDSTPDLYLFNPGTGAPWGLRAFMPAVETFSFCKTPISWAWRQVKRKVAIVMDDGSVVFPWFPTAWISEAANAGSRIPIPQGYRLPMPILSALQKRRDSIGNRKSKKPLTQEELDFLVFTDMIFRKDSPFCLEQQPVLEPVLESFGQLSETHLGFSNKFSVNIRDLARSIDGLKTTIQHHRKALLLATEKD